METGEQAILSGADLVGVYTGLMLNGRAVPSLISAGMEKERKERKNNDF